MTTTTSTITDSATIDIPWLFEARRDQDWSHIKVTDLTIAKIAGLSADKLALGWEAMDFRAWRAQFTSTAAAARFLAIRDRIDAEIARRGLVTARASDTTLMVGRPADFLPIRKAAA